MRDRHLIALGGLIALAAALRFATLDLQSFWYDEAVTVDLVRRGFGDMLRQIPDTESTPPLYYAIAWCWSKLFGTGEVGLRSLSAVFGTAAVGAFYSAAAELFSRRVGLVVAALAAVNPLLVWYSQEARAYELLVLLGALSLLFFARALRAGDRRSLALWALCSALALATHYFAAFLVLPEAVWLALRVADRRAAAAAVGWVAAVTAALVPLAVHQRSLDLASFIRDTSLASRLAKAPKQYLLGFDSPLEVASAALGLALAAAGAGLAWLRLREERGVRIAGVLLIVAVGAPFLLAVVRVDYFETRNVIAGWLPFAVVVSAGLLVAGGRAGGVALAALGALGLASVVGVWIEPSWRREDWRGAGEALGSTPVARAVVVSPASGTKPFELYRDDVRPLPRAGLSVTRAALVGVARRKANATHPPGPPRPARVAVPEFTETRRDYGDDYSVVFLKAPDPTGVTPGALGPYALTRGASAAVLIQRPTAGARRAHAARARRPGGG